MTKFNQAVLAAASSIALFAGALTLITPEANAQTTCSHSDLMNTTTCRGPGGTYRGSHSSLTNTTTWRGPNGSSTRCTVQRPLAGQKRRSRSTSICRLGSCRHACAVYVRRGCMPTDIRLSQGLSSCRP